MEYTDKYWDFMVILKSYSIFGGEEERRRGILKRDGISLKQRKSQ